MVALTRRRLLATAGVTGVFGGVISQTGGGRFEPAEADGWRHPQATPGNTAATEETGPGTAGEVDWSLQIDAPNQWRFRGLARHDDILFVPTHRRLHGVSTDGARRFVSEPGAERRFGVDAWTQLDSDPRILGERCLVASQASLYALDVDDGRARWRYDVNSSVDGLVLLGNTLYLSARVGSGQALLAVGARRGERLWRRRGRLVPLAASADVLVAATYHAGDLQGIDPATGDRLWRSDLRVPAPSLRAGTVALTDGALWHVRGGVLTAVEAETGETRWSADLDGDGSSLGDRLAIADGTYVLEPDAERLSAFEPDGDLRWSRDVEDAASGIAVGGETVYVATQAGLEAVDGDDGKRLFGVAPAAVPGEALTPLVTADAVYGLSGDTIYGVSES